MGYKDAYLALSESQAVVADADSTKFIDFEATDPGLRGQPLAVVVTIEAVTTEGDGITFELVHKTSEPTHADGAIASFTLLAADLAAGKEITLPLPAGMTLLRYFRLYYNITGGTESYTISAYLTPYPAAAR